MSWLQTMIPELPVNPAGSYEIETCFFIFDQIHRKQYPTGHPLHYVKNYSDTNGSAGINLMKLSPSTIP